MFLFSFYLPRLFLPSVIAHSFQCLQFTVKAAMSFWLYIVHIYEVCLKGTLSLFSSFKNEIPHSILWTNTG